MHSWKEYVREHLGPLDAPPEREAEVVEELAQQLEQAYSDALARGASEAQAMAITERQIPDWSALAREISAAGKPETSALPRLSQAWTLAAREDSLRRGGSHMLADLTQDLRFALRMLSKNRGFAAIVALTLALGIGANSTIFSVVYSVLLRPLPYPDSKDLVYLRESNLKKGWPVFSVSPANFIDWRDQSRSFSNIVALQYASYTYAGGEFPVEWQEISASRGFLETLRVQPALGRGFNKDDFTTGRDHVVLISDGLWRNAFGADPGVIGRKIQLSGESYDVIGVMPRGFQFSSVRTALWMPLVIDDSLKTVRGAHFMSVIARLKPGVTLEQARDDMASVARNLEKQYPDTNQDWGVAITRAQDTGMSAVRPALYILLGAVSVVLLIACANAANMLLARATVRYREMAVRHTLGASRWRILRQLLTESVVIALAGGLFGLALAIWSAKTLAALHPSFLPRSETVSVDWTVLLFTMGVAVTTGILFGLAPAIIIAGGNLAEALKEGGRAASGGRALLRRVFVVGEVALAFVLLVSAGLFMRSFGRLTSVEPGFRTGGTLSFNVSLPRAHYGSDVQQRGFYEQAQPRLAALPGVDSAVMTSLVPLSGSDEMYSLGVAGKPERPDQPSGMYYSVSPGYMRATGIRMLAGREFTADDSATSPRVCMVNDLLARTLFPGQDPVGQHLQIGRNYAVVREIVGVAASVNDEGLDEKPTLQVYEPFAQMPRRSMTFLLRTGGDPMTLLPAARHIVQELDPQLPVTNPMTLDDMVSESVALPRWRTVLLGLFAGLALVLSLIGLYGVLSYTVTQETREIGVRMAMGALPRDVLRLILSRGMSLVVVGVVLGLAAAFAATRYLNSFLFGVQPYDAATMTGATVLFALVAAVACWLPARRATRIDPLRALHYE